MSRCGHCECRNWTNKRISSALRNISSVMYNPMGCDDTISREMALKECHDIVVDGERYRVIQEETLLGLPHVTLGLPLTPHESKTVLYSGDGYADGYMVYDMAECPNCGYEYEDGDKDWGLPFCPNCGQSLKWI